MQDNISLLLEKINFDKEHKSYFKEATLDKIVGNKKKDSYQFYITLKKFLPTDIYDELETKIKETYQEFKKIQLIFSVEEKKEEKIQEYYRYLLEKKIEELPLLSMCLDNKVSLCQDVLTIESASNAEVIKLKGIEKYLIKRLEEIGFGKIKIKHEIDINKSHEVEAEIEKIKNNLKKNSVEVTSKIIKGKEIKGKTTKLSDILYEEPSVIVEAKIFDVEIKELTNFNLFTLKITDDTNSMFANVFCKKSETEGFKELKKELKIGSWFLFRGKIQNDSYKHELVLSVYDITWIKKEDIQIKDEAPIPRVELHTHTMMSQMDGVLPHKGLAKRIHKLGHKAFGITDHNGVQGFIEVFHDVQAINKGIEKEEEKFKAIYGTELTIVDEEPVICKNGNDSDIFSNKYVVFDVETTGLSPMYTDVIEIGAVLLDRGEVVCEKDIFINIGYPLSTFTTQLTGITDTMLKEGVTEEEAIKEFFEFAKDYPIVAQNAKFDSSYLQILYEKYGLGDLKNPILDTMELGRTLDKESKRNNLTALAKRYGIVWDEDAHHRANYDARGTAYIFYKMMEEAKKKGYHTLNDLNKLISEEEVYRYGRNFHVNILSKNGKGLKDLFKVVSFANTKYFLYNARIPKSVLNQYRQNLLVSSGCCNSEIFEQGRYKTDKELKELMTYYDFIEVQPLDVYSHLLDKGEFNSERDLKKHVQRIIRLAEEVDIPVVATGDVHHFTKEDKIYREIIVNQKVPGGGLHPLANKRIKKIPSQHFRTTEEMLQDFAFLGEEKAYEIVVTNSNLIADKTEIYDVVPQTHGVPFSPQIENSEQTVKDLVYGKAHSLYGNPLPKLIEDRIEQELSGIIKGGFDVIYLIAQKLVKKSNDDGYIVGSRGSVGSSFVATMMGITEVNPLPAHYLCPNCKTSIFDDDEGKSLGAKYSSGFDLPNKNCPNCGLPMNKEGQDMPFATFLGFNADKVPDIDLNFSGEYQWRAHEYTKELFGIDYVYRAGTIGTVAEKTAYGYVKGYCEDKGIEKSSAEIERLAAGCTGVKRTTGQHPGGIVVIPGYKDVFDFTPYQYPADDLNSLWKTTHFDYHAIDECVLKLDILGHDDPTMLRMLQDLSHLEIKDIPLDDKETMGIFCSPKPLGVTEEEILCPTGTYGVPEFGTHFVIQMLVDTKPKTFAELIKISGLSHGTDVWLGNAQELIQNNVVEFSDVIGCRDDIMVYLMYHGVEPIKAFKIMEFVRKGKASKLPDEWKNYEEELRSANIEEWFIGSCKKIKYMFPKAHAAAYVISAFRIAWFKVHHPLWYYAAYFSIRCSDFDIETMIAGYDAIKSKLLEIKDKGFDATNKETSISEVLEVALEATARGIHFAPLDINKSEATKFVLLDDNTLLPPFITIDGLGETVAKTLVEEREKKPFLSIEDLQKRGKVSGTLVDRMKAMGILDNMNESVQLSLF